MKRLYSATINSLYGLAHGFRTEAALREELICLLLALPIGIFVAPSVLWYVVMIGALLLMLAVEFLNTAWRSSPTTSPASSNRKSAGSRTSARPPCSA